MKKLISKFQHSSIDESKHQREASTSKSSNHEKGSLSIGGKNLSNDDEWVMLGKRRKFKGINSFPVYPGQSLLFVTAIPVNEKLYQEDVKCTLEPEGKIDKSGAYLYTTVNYPNNSQVKIPERWKGMEPRIIRVTHEFNSVMPVLKRKSEIGLDEKKLIIRGEPLSKELIQLYTQPTEWLNYNEQSMRKFIQTNNLNFNPSIESEVSFTMRTLKTIHKFVTYQQGLPFVDACSILDRGQGDCGCFSNVLASILRANKIPSRAAMGVAANKLEKKPSQDYNFMDGYIHQYHAMCQVYFKNLGWLLIEATNPNGVLENTYFEVFLTKHFDAIKGFEVDVNSFKPTLPMEPYEFEKSLKNLIDWNLEEKLLKSHTIPEHFNKSIEFLNYLYKRNINKCFSMLSKDLSKLFQDDLSSFKQFFCEANCPKEGDFVVKQDLIECSVCNGTMSLKIWCSLFRNYRAIHWGYLK